MPSFQVVGLLEANKTDIRELIMPYEKNIKEMLKELDEEELQQPVAEEAGNAGESNTANLHTIKELFKKIMHTLTTTALGRMQHLPLCASLYRVVTTCCQNG